MFIFVSGTSGSGKSSYAEKRLREFPERPKLYIATAKVYDSEMARRVEAHKLRREGQGFITIERSQNLGELEIPEGSSVLIEALTTWLANEIFEGGNDSYDLYNDFQKLRTRAKNIILVSDYIFGDGIIYDDSTENYIRTLAELTIKFAAEADEVIECFAGLIYNYQTVQKNE